MSEKHEVDIENFLKNDLRKEIDTHYPTKNLEKQILQSIHSPVSKDLNWALILRFSLTTVGCILGLILFVFYFSQADPLKIQFISGNGKIALNDQEIDTQKKDSAFPANGVLSTRDCQIVIMLASNSGIILDRQSSITHSSSKEFFLDHGRLRYFHPTAELSEFEFKTPHGSILPIGTEFDLDVSKNQLILNVFSGQVEYIQSAKSQIINAGESYEIINGSIHKKNITQAQPNWWIVESKVPWIQKLKKPF